MDIDPSISVGDIIAVVALASSVGFSAYSIVRTLNKDREERISTRADEVRSAAAKALMHLDRWQQINLGLYEQLQSVFVETSEILESKFDIRHARDFLWKTINEERAQIRQQLTREKISTSYVDLMPHFPNWRSVYQEALIELDAIEEYVYWQLLDETQSDVQSFDGKEKSYSSAKLGNLLRSTAEDCRKQLIKRSARCIAPVRDYLEKIIERPDSEIMQQTSVPSDIVRKSSSPRPGNGRLLWLGANPQDTARLNIKDEIEKIKHRLHDDDFFQVVEKWSVGPGELQTQIMRHRPAILHFSGHGNTHGELELHDDTFNGSAPVPGGALTEIFRLLGHDIQCVFLNACYSAYQGSAIADHVGCVVGMSAAVPDITAIEFSSAFYDALSHGESYQTAYEVAKNCLDLKTLPADDVPVLIDPFGQARNMTFKASHPNEQVIEKD